MITFVGDHICKLDAKGRLMLPAALCKQMEEGQPAKFIIKKDVFEGCLVLYPFEEWDRQVKSLRKKLNPYKKEHNTFLRVFFKGVAEAIADSSNRLLIPKRLLDEVGIDKDVVLAGQPGKIELWAKGKYDAIELSDDDFANMAEKLLDGFVDEAEE
ncbi:MAG: division/cell wall cluster transcriptional repressor MraZ [Bacteroidota bacterium]|nr:MAG: division/cell wall cluster transcriptional repressor MraZ [Bacteroidota bacterium]